MSFYYYYYLVRPTGLEPVTYRLEGGYCYPTELRAYLFMVRPPGFEPRTAEL